MNIQWYPGHMTKALRQIKEDIRLIDLVIELCDARIVSSSRNPEIRQLTNGKAHLAILNKADLAEQSVTDEWIRYFRENGTEAVAIDSRSRKDVKRINDAIMRVTEEKRQRDLRRGIKNRPVRALIAGIPNIGKSTLTNSLSGKKSTRTGDKPGVTKGKQWIHVNKGLDLLDTPGILWPKFEDTHTGEALALFGAIADNVFEKEELALVLYHTMVKDYPGRITAAYNISEDLDDAEVLPSIASSKNLVLSEGRGDTRRAADLFLDDLRSGKLGRVSLERP
ncbi:MAG: ribosome biogenesis GTPase YlqF [Lachnospiraceae bacterium]|nr:ribosome biogenesis GTPase YlqF [Lachnospiraceae bacterium]MDY2759117.1 ribosome biogenesis GTPase YlqF [Lachnospiraceae bacterium]